MSANKDILKNLKALLKTIEQTTNNHPPRVSLEALLLNEQWYRVWDLIKLMEDS